MSVLVMKFGGTSVGSAAAITSVVDITHQQRETWDQVAVVVSAMSGVTDMLIQGAKTAAGGDRKAHHETVKRLRDRHDTAMHELIPPDQQENVRSQIHGLIDEFALLCQSISVLGDASPRAMDAISSLGERMSVRLVAAAMRARGLDAEAIDASEIVVTTDQFGDAAPLHEPTRTLTRARLTPVLERGGVPVVTGFIGATEGGVTTTLGRGGSDYSGAIIGAALDADEIAIYTDVDGVMTTDPRQVGSARVLPALSYVEMGELAYFGAKVLHPRTVRPAIEREIPLRIRNTFNPEHPGTLVTRSVPSNGHPIRAVTLIRGLSLITVEGRGMIGVPGVAARTFGAVASVGANVLMISQASSEQSICFIVPQPASSQVVQALENGLAQELQRRDIDRIAANEGVSIVTAVGAGMRDTPGVASKVFGALAGHDINVVAIAQGSSECAISAVVAGADGDGAVRAIHELI